MSDFVSKLTDNKAKILIGLGGVALLGAIGYLYKNYDQQSNEKQQQVKQNQQEIYDIDGQIDKIRATINMGNPSFEDVKRIISFSLQASKRQIFKYSKNFKQDRRKFSKTERNNNLDGYLRMVLQGMNQIQQIGMTLQNEIMMKIGINQQAFMRYQNQLGPFMQQIMMSQGVGSQTNKVLDINQVKYAINLQIQYIRDNGNSMVDKLIQATGNWNQQEKSIVPTLISVYIADQVFEDHPEIDEDDLQGAEMKFQNQLYAEMMMLQQVMAPMMQKLTVQLNLKNNMGGMGGMGDMMGGMGDMMGQPTMEQMQQMQQLQRLRNQDPVAFQQIMMQMMGGMQ